MMQTKINWQNDLGIFEFEDVSKDDATDIVFDYYVATGLYLCMLGDEKPLGTPHSYMVTKNTEMLIDFMERNIGVEPIIYVQEMKNHADVIGYLTDLFELREAPEPPAFLAN